MQKSIISWLRQTAPQLGNAGEHKSESLKLYDSNQPWFSCISELKICMSLLVVSREAGQPCRLGVPSPGRQAPTMALQRQCCARLRRQLRHNGPRRLRLYARERAAVVHSVGAAPTRVERLLCLCSAAAEARSWTAAALRARAFAVRRQRGSLSSFMVLFSIASFGLISHSSQAFWAST